MLKFYFFKEKQFISRCMLFSTLKNIYIEKCPFTYWLNGRWFLQIVDRDRNLYPLYPLFPCSDFVSQMGGGGVMFFSYVMLFTTFLENKILRINFFFFFRKTIISQLMFLCWKY